MDGAVVWIGAGRRELHLPHAAGIEVWVTQRWFGVEGVAPQTSSVLNASASIDLGIPFIGIDYSRDSMVGIVMLIRPQRLESRDLTNNLALQRVTVKRELAGGVCQRKSTE